LQQFTIYPIRMQELNTPMLGVFANGGYCFLSEMARSRQQLKALGDSIRRHRTAAGMSQEQLAEKADLHPVYIGKIERGEQWISLHALLRIAAALRVRARDLVMDL
jgi:DNA-binding XRE family transcriptional regulator